MFVVYKQLKSCERLRTIFFSFHFALTAYPREKLYRALLKMSEILEYTSALKAERMEQLTTFGRDLPDYRHLVPTTLSPVTSLAIQKYANLAKRNVMPFSDLQSADIVIEQHRSGHRLGGLNTFLQSSHVLFLTQNIYLPFQDRDVGYIKAMECNGRGCTPTKRFYIDSSLLDATLQEKLKHMDYQERVFRIRDPKLRVRVQHELEHVVQRLQDMTLPFHHEVMSDFSMCITQFGCTADENSDIPFRDSVDTVDKILRLGMTNPQKIKEEIRAFFCSDTTIAVLQHALAQVFRNDPLEEDDVEAHEFRISDEERRQEYMYKKVFEYLPFISSNCPPDTLFSRLLLKNDLWECHAIQNIGRFWNVYQLLRETMTERAYSHMGNMLDTLQCVLGSAGMPSHDVLSLFLYITKDHAAVCDLYRSKLRYVIDTLHYHNTTKEVMECLRLAYFFFKVVDDRVSMDKVFRTYRTPQLMRSALTVFWKAMTAHAESCIKQPDNPDLEEACLVFRDCILIFRDLSVHLSPPMTPQDVMKACVDVDLVFELGKRFRLPVNILNFYCATKTRQSRFAYSARTLDMMQDLLKRIFESKIGRDVYSKLVTSGSRDTPAVIMVRMIVYTKFLFPQDICSSESFKEMERRVLDEDQHALETEIEQEWQNRFGAVCAT